MSDIDPMVDGGTGDGGGAGGGPHNPNRLESAEGGFQIRANQVELLSRPPLPPAVGGPSVITIFAPGLGTDGNVDIRGSKGVRITAGPPPLPATASDSTIGVEIMVGEAENVTIQRGLTPLAQKVELTPGGIKLQCGSAPTSPTIEMVPDGITLSAGMSSIQIGVDGVLVIEGLVVRITGDTIVAINS